MKIVKLSIIFLLCVFLIPLGLTSCSSKETEENSDKEIEEKEWPPKDLGHNAGANCMSCHLDFKVAGTVFKDETASDIQPAAGVSLIKADGSKIILDVTDDNGNIASALIDEGYYLIQVASITSRTWHKIPEQESCNNCHIYGGNASSARTKEFHFYHTRIPSDNDCTHCHHFPASMSLGQLRTPGVLNAQAEPPAHPGSRVEIEGEVYFFDPSEYSINTVRPDIFAPGYFSMFDVILAVAEKNNINIDYEYDESRKTHFIEKINNISGDYWYHFSYDVGSGNSAEIAYRRAYRWDEALWRPGVWIKVVHGENLDEIKAEYFEEIARESSQGHVIPHVKISLNPSIYKGNPTGSHRISVVREFYDVEVTPHNLRGLGYLTLYSKPFQPGVTTSLDILLSLKDQDELELVTSVFYTFFAQKYIESFYVVALGFPDVGIAHASGRQGFVYVTNNGTFERLPNNADRKFHMTSDICVVHAPDFSYWRWIELGNPYYETTEPGSSQFLSSIAEDFNALGRGFNLHKPVVEPDNGRVNISCNIFQPGHVSISVHKASGQRVAILFNNRIKNIGIKKLEWKPKKRIVGPYSIVMCYENFTQMRNFLLKN